MPKAITSGGGKYLFMNKSVRFSELDLLRLLAALSVVCFHYTFRGAAADNLSPISFPAIAPLSKYGYLGVNLFFMISGFVILMTAQAKSATDFMISRMIRLYPAYWCCCSITFIATLLFGGEIFQVSWRDYVINMTMLNGFFYIPNVDGAYWSLLVELKYYMLIFIVLLLGQRQNVRYFLGLWLVLTIAASVTSLTIPSKIYGFLNLDCSAYLIAGAVFYLIYQEGSSPYKITLLCLSYLQALGHAHQEIIGMAIHYHTRWNTGIVMLAISVFFVFFLLMIKGKTSIKQTRWVMLLGLLTYPLYLLHQNLGYILFNTLSSYINSGVLISGTIIGMLFFAYLINRNIEARVAKPLETLLRQTIADLERCLFKLMALVFSLYGPRHFRRLPIWTHIVNTKDLDAGHHPQGRGRAGRTDQHDRLRLGTDRSHKAFTTGTE